MEPFGEVRKRVQDLHGQATPRRRVPVDAWHDDAVPTIRQLEYFVAVHETGSFTRAAEQLGVSQPALSHQFRALESELGADLVERLPRRLRLTPAGQAALPHARATLAQARWAVDAARRPGEDARCHLVVATLYSLSIGLLPDHLAALRARFPQLGIHLREHRHKDDLRSAMAAGEGDVAVGPVPRDWTGPVHRIDPEEFVVVGPPHGPRAVHDGVAIRDLADAPWISYTPESGLGDMFEAVVVSARVEPRVVLLTEQSSSAIAYARAGIGLTVVPLNVAAQHRDISIAHLEPPLVRDLAVYARAAPDVVTQFFIDGLLSA